MKTNKQKTPPSTTSSTKKSDARKIGIKAKLQIGQPGDKYEREADAIADKVVQMSTNSYSPLEGGKEGVPIQRKCSDCEKEEKLQRKPLISEISPSIQRMEIHGSFNPSYTKFCADPGVWHDPSKACDSRFNQYGWNSEVEKERPMVYGNCKNGNRKAKFVNEDHVHYIGPCDGIKKPVLQAKSDATPSFASDATVSKLSSSKGGGSPLPEGARSEMENKIGADFSQVKIHTGSSAIQMNQELNAQAFTHGNDIYFNSGKYNPGSNEGKHLLAHELVHTVQQKGKIHRKSKQFKKAEEVIYDSKGDVFAGELVLLHHENIWDSDSELIKLKVKFYHRSVEHWKKFFEYGYETQKAVELNAYVAGALNNPKLAFSDDVVQTATGGGMMAAGRKPKIISCHFSSLNRRKMRFESTLMLASMLLSKGLDLHGEKYDYWGDYFKLPGLFTNLHRGMARGAYKKLYQTFYAKKSLPALKLLERYDLLKHVNSDDFYFENRLAPKTFKHLIHAAMTLTASLTKKIVMSPRGGLREKKLNVHFDTIRDHGLVLGKLFKAIERYGIDDDIDIVGDLVNIAGDILIRFPIIGTIIGWASDFTTDNFEYLFGKDSRAREFAEQKEAEMKEKLDDLLPSIMKTYKLDGDQSAIYQRYSRAIAEFFLGFRDAFM